MNIIEIEKQLAIHRAFDNQKEIKQIHDSISAYRLKMDRWFDKYLDIFSEKIGEETRDPVKALYDKKFKEYVRISDILKSTSNYLSKKA